jgi:small nuclear ribonucleoprotein (snRNP)-like protein
MDASSPNFDPLAMLLAPTERVYSANPWMAVSSTSILDNLGKCATLLPQDDPLFRESHHKQQQLRKAVALAPSIVQAKTAPQAASSSSDNNTKDTKKRLRTSNPHPFEAIAAQLDAGPHSLLVRLREERKRVTVVVRYVNMVRGNLTGTLLAFDKHLNMILRDVEEVYSPRLVDEEHSLSNLDLELERRRRVEAAAQAPAESPFAPQPSSQPEPGTWNVRRRQMKQLMVRGDMVVSVYEANEENRNITRSRYRKRSATGNAKVDENNNTAKRQKSDKNT